MIKILNDSIIGKLLKTFLEGFIASLVITLPTITNINDFELIKSIFVGAVAMGISAILNLIQQKIDDKYNGKRHIKY